MNIKNPKNVIPAMVTVLLIVAVCTSCTFKGADTKKQDLSMLNIKNLAKVSYEREELFVSRAPGRDRGFNISARRVAEYLESVNWTVKKMESPLELTPDLQIEWNEDQELRFYESEPLLAMVRMNEQWRYYTIGKDDYEKVLAIINTAFDIPQTETMPVSYSLMQLGNGAVLRTLTLLSADEVQLASDIIMSCMVKSAAWPGVDVTTLDECYLLRATYSGGTSTDYYAYLLDGKAVMQRGTDGHYIRIDDGLYKKLVRLLTTVSGVDRTNLDACVADAILTTNISQYHKSDFAAEAHTVLKTVESGNTTMVYAMALYQEFGYAGSGFCETSGSHMPVAITFKKNAAGEYKLKEYWTPQDGSYYAPSIKEKFPADIYKDALDTQKYIVAHIQSCYAQAIEYGNVPVSGHLAKLVETICSSPAEASNPRAYIDAHPIEYREMIYYGNYTLRYCFNLFEQGGQTGLDGHIMASACRDIVGKKEDIGLLANTGQDWYDAFKKQAENLRAKHGDDYMKKNKPGSWLLLQMLAATNN
ncbi:MAG TPA: hypothetical protein GX016_10070 [Firmicutes bacterium]|nr:hypothetical protein [Bacillota bacterium]